MYICIEVRGVMDALTLQNKCIAKLFILVHYCSVPEAIAIARLLN